MKAIQRIINSTYIINSDFFSLVSDYNFLKRMTELWLKEDNPHYLFQEIIIGWVGLKRRDPDIAI